MSGSHADGPDSLQGAGAQTRPRRLRPWMLAVIGIILVAVIAVVAWSAVASARTDGSASVAPTGTDSATPVPTSSPTDAAATADPPVADPAAGDDVRATSDPHPFDVPAEIAPGVSATVTNLTAVTGVASGVGESAGPAVRFEVTISNDSGETIDLQNVRALVDYGSDLAPASELSGGPDIVAFPATLEAGASTTAAYVFAVPVEGRSDVRITLDYLASVPFALFSGAAPAA